MTRKSGPKQLKRLPAPANWPIHRKEFKWVVKPKTGTYSFRESLPLLIVVRELLKLVKDRNEAKAILSEGQVKVDGKIRHSDSFAVGIMDVIEIDAMKKAFRVLPSGRGLLLHDVEGDEKGFKLCKIVGKTTVEGGAIQLHLHDGRNINIDVSDPKHPIEDIYRVGDILKVKLPDYEVLDHLKFEEGVLGIVNSGENVGSIVEIAKIIEKPWPTTSSAALKDRDGKQFETILDYIFPIGKGKPWISISRGSEI